MHQIYNVLTSKSIKQIRSELKQSNDIHLQNMERVLDDNQINFIVQLLEEE